jgi:prophage antirepressor-like protein
MFEQEHSTTALSIFTFQDMPVRTFIIDEEIWFIAADICKILDIGNTSMAVSRLNPKGISTTDTLTSGGIQKVTIVNEPNLYRLISQSRKPEAETFQNWMYEEVLPSIRKTGGYSLHQGQENFTATFTLSTSISPAELEHIEQWVDATKALFYPRNMEKNQERQHKKLLLAQAKDDLLHDEIIRHMTRLAERGHVWVPANEIRPYMKKPDGKNIEKAILEQKMQEMTKANTLQSQKTTQTTKYKLV